MKNNIELRDFAKKFIGQGGYTFRSYCGLGSGSPWCNAFVTYILHKGGFASLYCNGKKQTYCPNSIKWCQNNLANIPIYLALPMDIVYFDWEGNGVPNHIGFAWERNTDQSLYTIEGNTSGGIVARRTRSLYNKNKKIRYIQAVFRPHYPVTFTVSKPLVVDGYFGYNSIAMLQKVLGLKPDGILGQGTVKALQKLVGVSQDGSWGPKTSKAVQKLVGTTVDGEFGPKSVKALQTWINKKANFPRAKPEKKPETVAPAPKPATEKKSYKVIDVSYWQKEIDWKKVKADGVVGAIIRYADGKTLDSYFDRNVKNAKAEGIHVGSYIFSRATTKAEAESEAERLFNACKPYNLDMPMYIDLEVSGLSKYANTVAQAFLNKMSALGGRGGVYANLNWWNNYLADTANKYSSHPFWIAQYNSKITHKTPSLFGMWQYTSTGRVNGINGNVDMNHCYISYWGAKPVKTDVTPVKKGYDGVIPSLTLKKTTTEVREDAIRFAKWIVSDNRFGYGRMGGAKYKGTKEYSITHSGGCHFCGTNASKISKAKKANLKNPEEWEYTYVCNPFVHAAYAHAGVLSMLKKSTHSWWISSYQNSSVWSEVKKPSKMSDLKAGDVCAWDSHICLYIGNGKGAEATSQGDARAGTKKWADCIHIINDFSHSFKNTTHVFRYIGTVNSTALIKYGEVSKRVKDLQSYLNWYGIKLTADGLFGDATLDAVKKFQKEQKLTVDGIVGSKTIEAMKVKTR